MMLGEALGDAANLFLGMCMIFGAAFVFQRSKRAALFVALGGLCYVIPIPLEMFIGRMGYRMGLTPYVTHFFFALVSMARHVGLFAGLAMGMRTIAVQAPS